MSHRERIRELSKKAERSLSALCDGEAAYTVQRILLAKDDGEAREDQRTMRDTLRVFCALSALRDARRHLYPLHHIYQEVSPLREPEAKWVKCDAEWSVCMADLAVSDLCDVLEDLCRKGHAANMGGTFFLRLLKGAHETHLTLIALSDACSAERDERDAALWQQEAECTVGEDECTVGEDEYTVVHAALAEPGTQRPVSARG